MNDMQAMSHESSGICWCGPNNHGPEGTPATATLAGIKSQLSGITPGQWKAWNRGIGYEVHSEHDEPINVGHRETFTKADASFIAAAPGKVERLTNALEAVLGFEEQAVGDKNDLYASRHAEGCNDMLNAIRAAVEAALTN